MMRAKKIITFLFLAFGVSALAQDQYAWVQRASLPAVGRHRACGCSVHNRGYIGLGHINNVTGEVIYADWWEYDPGTDTWMQKANFPMGPRYHAVAFGLGNYAYVGTGSGNTGDNNDMWRFNPATNSWAPMAQVPGGVRSGAVAFSINGKGYVALGDFQNDCEEYDPATNSWTTKMASTVSGYSAVAAVANGKAYVGVGSGTTWAEFDPAANTWTPKATFPGAYRFGSGCFSYNGWVYVVSGSDWGQEFSDSWAYNPLTDQWVQVSDFPGQGRHYFVCFTIGNHAYGGTGTSGTNYNDFWEYGSISDVTETTSESGLSVFPNPVVDRAQFLFGHPLDENATFLLMDLQGKKVKEETIPAGAYWMFERSDLAAGTYAYCIMTADKKMFNGKLALQ